MVQWVYSKNKVVLSVTEAERQAILSSAKSFFRARIAENHKANTEKLSSLEKFNINPFTHKYLAQFAFGDSSPESMAKALIYPRVLGTSISTTFGTQLQYFCNEVLSSYASNLSMLSMVAKSIVKLKLARQPSITMMLTPS